MTSGLSSGEVGQLINTGLSVARATSANVRDHAGAAVPRGERAITMSILGSAITAAITRLYEAKASL